jgi:DNA-binding NtrC family response regulator
MYYSWHGNIRQLKNAIEYGVVNAKDDMITIDDLPDDVIKENSKFSESLKPSEGSFEEWELKLADYIKELFENAEIKSLKEIREKASDTVEKTIIEKTLRETNGNVTESAKRLHMTRGNLNILIKRYGIKVKDFRK